MSVVVDASVASKWFLQESDSAMARSILAAGLPLVGPDLVIAEVTNVAWLKHRIGDVTRVHAEQMVASVAQLFDSLVACQELCTRAYAIAAEITHPAYDCFYLALAERLGCRFVTADSRLLAAVRARAWAATTVRLADFRP
jgi:predicted nucleic acid-binding protein